MLDNGDKRKQYLETFLTVLLEVLVTFPAVLTGGYKKHFEVMDGHALKTVVIINL